MMAKIVYNGQEIQVPDNSRIEPVCEELGVPFACRVGVCGVCQIEILNGEDNLTDLTDAEKALGCDKSHRLACQCSIRDGTVEINF